MRVQVTPDHYDFERYDSLQRWCSYWYQLKEVLALRPRTVLEHLPHERFDACLSALARRAPHVVLSLPHHGFAARLSFAFLGVRLSLGTRLPLPTRFKPDHQHQWELDFGRHSVANTTRELERHFEVVRGYHVKENPYHYLWVLRSRSVWP